MLSARSWVCGGGQEGLWSAQRTQITPLEHRLGPGNTNQRLGWVLGGWYTGYYPTHPPRPAPPPGTPPPHRTLHQGVLMVGTALLDRSKEILGVDNAHVWGRSQYPRSTDIVGTAPHCSLAAVIGLPESTLFSVSLPESTLFSVSLPVYRL